jgi:hypothetical protein
MAERVVLDLNLEPPSDDLEQNDPIDWDGIEEWDGPAHELDYKLVWHDADEVVWHDADEGECSSIANCVYSFCRLE